jgi:hypothetical protein
MSKANINMQKVQSSQISEIGYDKESQTLAVRFNGFGDKPGRLYHYSNVSPELFAQFEGADSKGSFFIRNIKPNPGKYPYEKIDETKQDEAEKAETASAEVGSSESDPGAQGGSTEAEGGDEGADRSNIE